MATVLTASSADNIWYQLADNLSANGKVLKGGRGGTVRELESVTFSLSDPRQRWILCRQPPINPAFAIAEIIWILNGCDRRWFLQYFNRQFNQYVGNQRQLHGAYGARLRTGLGFDQLKHSYLALKRNPSSRQIVLQIWDGRKDLPSQMGTPQNKDIPCNIVSMLKIRQGCLHWTQIMRSNDINRGLPHNIIQFTTLHEVMAGWLELELGPYVHFADSLHCYKQDWPCLSSKLRPTNLKNNDVFVEPFAHSERLWQRLEVYVNQIIDPHSSVKYLARMMASLRMPVAYQNLLSLPIAEGMRRRAALNDAAAVMADCNNLLYQTMWTAWLNRLYDHR